MAENNETLLREGECSYSNCIEPTGHDGPHTVSMLRIKDQHIAALEARNARLQERVEEAEAFCKDVQEYRDFWLAKYDEVTMKRADVDRGSALTEARRLLKLTQAILHGYACQQEDDCLEACEMTRAYLARPMTKCEAALAWLQEYHLVQAHAHPKAGLVDGCEACERFRAASSREGELLAALERIANHARKAAICAKTDDDTYEIAEDFDTIENWACAALAQGKKE